MTNEQLELAIQQHNSGISRSIIDVLNKMSIDKLRKQKQTKRSSYFNNKLMIFILIIPAMLSACTKTYQSLYEARHACDEWVSKGKKHSYKHDVNDRWMDLSERQYQIKFLINRVCKYEEETKQVLGLETQFQEGIHESFEDVPSNYVVQEHFKYKHE